MLSQNSESPALSDSQLKTTFRMVAESSHGIAIDPLTLVMNECMILSSAMRKMTRWSHSSVPAILGTADMFGDDQFIKESHGFTPNYSNGIGRVTGSGDNPLVSGMLQLRSILSEAQDIREIDSLTLFQPFLLIIKSSSTSGNITALALDSIGKCLKYGLISHDSKNLQYAVIQIISALTHCRFEAADQESDDTVLLKVLTLLEKLLESSFSNLLPNEVISEVVQTCLSLACNKRRSEVLRRAAEMAMKLITFKIFSQLKYMEVEVTNVDELKTDFSDAKLPEDLIGGTLKNESELSLPSTVKKAEDNQVTMNKDEASENKRGDEAKHDKKSGIDDQEPPFDIICINDFLGILISMISPYNQYQHMESTRVFALSLINISIEVAGLEMPKHPSLMNLIADPISKHVLQIMTTTNSPALLKASIQVFSTMTIALRPQLKLQVELTFSLIFKSILHDTQGSGKIKGNNTSLTTRTPLSKETLIESISLLWTRFSSFFISLFIDYDCDFERSDLAAKMIDFLCDLALPESANSTTDNVPPICLEGVLAFIGGINDRIKNLPEDSHLKDLKLHDRLVDKNKKKEFIKCTDVLNTNPKLGIKLLVEKEFLKLENDYEELAKFFFNKSGRLNKKVLGEFLAKPSNKELLKHFIYLFDFSNLRVDEALRVLLKSFRLPGESQQIERVVEIFAERYVDCQEYSQEEKEDEEVVKPDKDAVFILSYSIIMLNTDLHSPQVKRQMDLESYQRNVRGVYNGHDFPAWYLSKIYYSVRDREIIMPEEHHGTDKWFDDAWNNLITAQAAKYFAKDLRTFSPIQVCQFDQCVFEATINKIIDTLFSVFREASDDHIITSLMSYIDKCANICMFYGLSEPIDKLINSLADLSTVSQGAHKTMNTEDIREEIPLTQIKLEQREEVVTISELAVSFGRDFKAQISTVVLFRLIKKTRFRVSESWLKVIKIILRFFENCLINPNIFVDFQKKISLDPLNKAPPRYKISKVKSLKESGILSTFSSFLRGYSDEPPEPTDQEVESTLSTIDCIKSLNLPGIFENVSQGPAENLRLFTLYLLDQMPEFNNETERFYESEVEFLYEIIVCFCLLLKEEGLIKRTVTRIQECKKLHKISQKSFLRLQTYLLLLIRNEDSGTRNTLQDSIKEISALEEGVLQTQGHHLVKPLISLVDSDSWCCKLLLNDETYWNALKAFCGFPTYASDVLDFTNSLITSSSSEITKTNFLFILNILDEISSLGAIGSELENETPKQNGKETDNEAEVKYYKDIIELSKRSISLTAELGVAYKNSFGATESLYSLIQALAHQCFNPCREIRSCAITTLQVNVLSVDSNDSYSAGGIFEYGLFPLLTELSKPEVIQTDSHGFIKTQIEALSLVSKVFLNVHSQFDVDQLEKIWLLMLDHFTSVSNSSNIVNNSDSSIKESGSEIIKNMILVLKTNTSLQENSDHFWTITWEKVREIYPELKHDLGISFKDAEVVEDSEVGNIFNTKETKETTENDPEIDKEKKVDDGIQTL